MDRDRQTGKSRVDYARNGNGYNVIWDGGKGRKRRSKEKNGRVREEEEGEMKSKIEMRKKEGECRKEEK